MQPAQALQIDPQLGETTPDRHVQGLQGPASHHPVRFQKMAGLKPPDRRRQGRIEHGRFRFPGRG